MQATSLRKEIIKGNKNDEIDPIRQCLHILSFLKYSNENCLVPKNRMPNLVYCKFYGCWHPGADSSENLSQITLSQNINHIIQSLLILCFNLHTWSNNKGLCIQWMVKATCKTNAAYVNYISYLLLIFFLNLIFTCTTTFNTLRRKFHFSFLFSHPEILMEKFSKLVHSLVVWHSLVGKVQSYWYISGMLKKENNR